jgi:hypothetical protein
LGSNKFIWLKIFAIAHDNWTNPDQSSGPQLECCRAFYASSLAHQVTNSSIHGFHAARSSWEMEFRIFSIGSEMLDASEKLPNDHAHDAQSFCFANKASQFFEYSLQPPAIGQLQGFADMLVKRFTQGSTLQAAIASASAVL